MLLVYTGTKLEVKFNVKDKTKKEHHRDLTYSVKCPMKNCPTVTLDELTVLSSGYRNRKFNRKVSESLFIKQNRPTLNKRGTSVPLRSSSIDRTMSPEMYPVPG